MASKSPCAACKLQRKKCTVDCIFAPYFPVDNPNKFNNVHRVFGLNNIQKILGELPLESREAAVESLVFEANCRIYDEVYGCSGFIHFLNEHLEKLKSTLEEEKMKLANYMIQTNAIDDYIAQTNIVGRDMHSQLLGHPHYSNGEPSNTPMTSMQETFIVSEPQQQHMYNPQQLVTNQQTQYPQAMTQPPQYLEQQPRQPRFMEQQSQILYGEHGVSLNVDTQQQDRLRYIDNLMMMNDHHLAIMDCLK